MNRLREVKDLLDSLNTKTRLHGSMSCHGPSDASEMTLYEKVLQMHVVTLTELTGRYRVTKYTGIWKPPSGSSRSEACSYTTAR